MEIHTFLHKSYKNISVAYKYLYNFDVQASKLTHTIHKNLYLLYDISRGLFEQKVFKLFCPT